MLCGDATSKEAVARLLGDLKPLLLVTDRPYGIEVDSEWRDRAEVRILPKEPILSSTCNPSNFVSTSPIEWALPFGDIQL